MSDGLSAEMVWSRYSALIQYWSTNLYEHQINDTNNSDQRLRNNDYLSTLPYEKACTEFKPKVMGSTKPDSVNTVAIEVHCTKYHNFLIMSSKFQAECIKMQT